MRLGLAAMTLAATPLAWPLSATGQPFGDEPLRVEGDAIVVARFAAPDERIGPLSARRLSSRRRAEREGREAMHRFADDALHRVMAQPDVASRVHAVLESESVEVRVRPMVDGSAVVELWLPLAALRQVAPLTGVPW